MAHKIYDNFYLSNEVEDQFNSHLDLQQFCTVDNSLVGTAGMKRKINVYKATAGTEKLKMGEGNTKSIEVSFTPEEYEIQLAQNKFQYYDEQEMTDPMLVPVGTRHMGTDMFNTVNGDVYGEFKKATMVVPTAKIDFAAFVDAVANLNIESTDNQPEKVAPQTFAFVHPGDTAELRKNLAEDLKYVEAFARAGYIGTVGGVNIYTKKDATKGTIVVATRQAVTIFNKKGVEVETDRNGDIRQNTIWSRKYYLAALTDATKAVKIFKGIAFTRKRLLTHLRKYYAQHGSNEGYILLIDFSKYYDNIRHDVLLKLFEQYVDDEHALWLLRKTVERSRVDVSYMSDEEYEHCLDKLFDSLLYQYMNPKLFTGEKFMGKHLNIGDQVAQTAGISYRIRIDNYVKIVRGVKFYAGYMDDSYAIHESKEFLQELLEDIIEIANELGITVNTRKTRICKLSEHWRFLQVQYSLTDTGRVIQKINPKRLTAMRRKMKKLAPKLTEKEFTDFYKSWFKNHYKIMSKKQRSNMDTLFNQLKEVTKCTLSPLPMAQS